jgi:tetratricopeptide (TPR) repeat protein
LDNSLPALFQHWKGQSPKAKRVLVADGILLARFRFVGDQGISIIDLALTPGADGWKFVDWHNRSVGMSYVEQMRQMILPALANLDRGFLARLFGPNAVKAKDLEASSKLARDQLKGDYQAVLAGYSKLPPALQNMAGVRSVYLGALAQVGDEKQYIAELERAVAQFPAPMFRFTLIDAYFLNKQWDKTIELIDEFMTAVERDAALLTMRALVLVEAERVAEARKVLHEAQELEPDCEYVHSSGLDVLVAAKDWKAVRASIEFLEKTGRFKFRGALEGEGWAEFRKQPESEPWR